MERSFLTHILNARRELKHLKRGVWGQTYWYSNDGGKDWHQQCVACTVDISLQQFRVHIYFTRKLNGDVSHPGHWKNYVGVTSLELRSINLTQLSVSHGHMLRGIFHNYMETFKIYWYPDLTHCNFGEGPKRVYIFKAPQVIQIWS